MIGRERLFKILFVSHLSEKVSSKMEKFHTVVFKVAKDATKKEIKIAVHKLFEVEVNNVHTLIVKGKCKRRGQHIGHRRDWKKAYVSLKKGQNMDFIENIE